MAFSYLEQTCLLHAFGAERATPADTFSPTSSQTNQPTGWVTRSSLLSLSQLHCHASRHSRSYLPEPLSVIQPDFFQVWKLEDQQAEFPSTPMQDPGGAEGPLLLGEEPGHILEGHTSWIHLLLPGPGLRESMLCLHFIGCTFEGRGRTTLDRKSLIEFLSPAMNSSGTVPSCFWDPRCSSS